MSGQPSGRYMTDQIREVLRRYGRFVWGGAAVLLLLVLLGSVVLPGSSDEGSEADAQARAESLSGSFIERSSRAALLELEHTGRSPLDVWSAGPRRPIQDRPDLAARRGADIDRPGPTRVMPPRSVIRAGVAGLERERTLDAGTYHDGLDDQ